uniref:Uncharacterized protein n=1 Tax=Chromera velia CCMP2878 TaxID=1169474 RepID=A0A0G4HYE9_9ALVE|eukprot:Cvel_33537.t1-p1 / transcript=Cvel_33537.t1 / gene=Cvel_33537 / organism=Chromera_velia_CCMP2878 / gene_product=hypothetical protein / transcript_product=hypothetical protein / location=Cvel_scaffold5474:841-1841(+) / protein_length=235 / sequence_SO=supercontig / SO=protein_coding / is_pseudo=false
MVAGLLILKFKDVFLLIIPPSPQTPTITEWNDKGMSDLIELTGVLSGVIASGNSAFSYPKIPKPQYEQEPVDPRFEANAERERDSRPRSGRHRNSAISSVEELDSDECPEEGDVPTQEDDDGEDWDDDDGEDEDEDDEEDEDEDHDDDGDKEEDEDEDDAPGPSNGGRRGGGGKRPASGSSHAANKKPKSNGKNNSSGNGKNPRRPAGQAGGSKKTSKGGGGKGIGGGKGGGRRD